MTLEKYVGRLEGRNLRVLTRRFEALDSDGDGRLTLFELAGGK